MNREDHDQFAELFVRNQTRVYRYIISFVPHRADADELFQQSNLTIWKLWDRYEPDRPFLPWACGIAQNHIRNFLRHRRNLPKLFDDEFMNELAQTFIEEDEYLTQRQNALAQCLEKLTPRQRDLISQCYGDGESMKRIARKRGQSSGSLYKAVQRIRVLLFDCINQTLEAEASP